MGKSFQITSGRVKKPFNIMLYSLPGFGKSTFAQSCPEPLFLGAEENDELTASRLPIPKSYDEFVEQIDWVQTTKPKFKTLVIDTIDSIEKMLHKKILDQDPKGTGSMIAAHGGYGKAYDKAETEFIVLKNKLKLIRDDLGMNIILLAHSKKATAIDTILGMQYDTYEMNLHQKAQNVFVDWCSAVLFGTYINYQKDDVNTDKKFVMGDGERVLFTERRPGYTAKNRYNLSYELSMPQDYPCGHFMKGYEDFYAGKSRNPDDIKKNILGLLANIQDQSKVDMISKAVEQASGDVKKLETIEKRVKEIVGG